MKADPRDILIGYLDGGKRAVTLADFQDLQWREWLKVKSKRDKEARKRQNQKKSGG